MLMFDLTSKLGENNDIEHNKGSIIYPKNQLVLDCILKDIRRHQLYIHCLLHMDDLIIFSLSLFIRLHNGP